MTFLTDKQIADLIDEPKFLSKSSSGIAEKMRVKKGHKEYDLNLARSAGGSFRVILRQSIENVLDFSAIVAYIPEKSHEIILLRRYNGKSHEHSNKLEKSTPFYDFHIHYATERYQESGFRIEYYAESTDRYSSLSGAFSCLLSDCNISMDSALTIDTLFKS